MALNGENGDNASASIRPDDENITREPAGERRNKRRADDEESTPTAVDIPLSDVAGARAPGVPRAQVAPEGPEAPTLNECAKSMPASATGIPCQRQRRRQAHAPDARPQAHVGPDAPVASPVFTSAQLQQLLSLLQQQAPTVTETNATPNETSISAKSAKEKKETVKRARTAKIARAEGTTAKATPAPENPADSDTSDDEAGEAPADNAFFSTTKHLRPLPTSNPNLIASSFKNAAVREQAELLEDLRAYLMHAEQKVRLNEPASAIELLEEALSLVNNRFKLLHFADYTNFRVANRFKMYEEKSLFTSRPFKQAMADVAAMERAQGNPGRAARGGGRGTGAFGNKRGPPMDNNIRSFRGTCFKCGQPGHMANMCPDNGRPRKVPALQAVPNELTRAPLVREEKYVELGQSLRL
ncbi:unnamed protein product [Closterium sp. NIES-54]